MDELNRDLLIAVLALMTNAISRTSLSAALTAWSRDREQSLARLLHREGVLDGDRLRALECLADAHLRGHQHDLRLCLDAWNAYDLTQEVLTEIGDVALQTTLGLTLGGSTKLPVGQGNTTLPVGQGNTTLPVGQGNTTLPVGQGNTTLPVGQESPEGSEPPSSLERPQFTQGDRFRPIRPHARGGIGQVWVARDCELQREVALKVIQPRYAEREDHRARFLIEAEITGNLEHPGIVPVYSLGQHADGRPYYAMRFIRGESLSAAIREFHEQFRPQAGAGAGQSRPMWGIEFRQLLGRFLDVCDAMDYAHSRGVLHRDLKPANIMLGRYGETLVVDWGLAKVIGQADVPPPAVDEEVEPSLAAATTSSQTQQGIAHGTPAYMSPEQARGSLDELGPASDVYSLGATLYELLTGRVAFPADKLSVVLERVLKGEFPPPRAVLRSVPAPLEAICLKAMSLRPEHRYASVRELARDLEHWLADEPVAAFPERRLQRLGRWLRQHRTWTHAAAAGLIGITLAATIGFAVVERARRQEADARKEAELSFIMAQQAVDDYLTRVSENTLLKEQDSLDSRGLRRELLENALEYYQRFVRQRSNDPLIRQELAKAYFRVGQITQEIGSPQDAIAAFFSSLAIWESLAKADPGDREAAGRLADCSLAIGRLQNRTDNLQGALKSLNQARAILEPLVVQHPDVADLQATLASCYSEIGVVVTRLESPEQGLTLLKQAREIQQRLTNRHPKDARYRVSLAEIINVQGYIFHRKPDDSAAIRSFEEVRDIFQGLLEPIVTGPKPIIYLNWLAQSHYNIAEIQLKQNRIDAALNSYEESLKYRDALVQAHPSVPRFQANLADSYNSLAWVQQKARQPAKAFESLQHSFAILQALVRSQPDRADYHSQLGRSWNLLGNFRDQARDNPAALVAFRNAVGEQRQAVARSEEVNPYKTLLCTYLENLGEQSLDLGRAAEGLPSYEEALTIRRRLYQGHSGSREYIFDLVEALSTLGTIHRHTGNASAALERIAEARSVLEESLASAPGDAALAGQLGAILTQQGCAMADLGPPGPALPLLQEAVNTLRGLSPAAGDETQHRERLSEALWEWARLLRTLHQPRDADRLADQRRALWKDRPRELAELALKQTTSRAALIGYGQTPVSHAARAVRELDLAQAADNLRLAIALGFQDPAMLRGYPDFAMLQARADIRPLIEGMEAADRRAGTRSQK